MENHLTEIFEMSIFTMSPAFDALIIIALALIAQKFRFKAFGKCIEKGDRFFNENLN
jgi:hypothetical protein